MLLSGIALADIVVRGAAIGQLILLLGVSLGRIFSGAGKASLLAAVVCGIAYLLLTAPVPNADYGVFRNFLLVLTDAWAYAIWLACMYLFHDGFSIRSLPIWARGILAAWVAWHLYFFGWLAGNGIYHDINHGISILLLAHVIYVALKGLSDDLVDGRRRFRLMVSAALAVYGVILAGDQLLLGGLVQDYKLSLANAVIAFFSISALGIYSLGNPEILPRHTDLVLSDEQSARRQVPALSPESQALKARLDEFVERGDFRQPDLSIARMARQLDCKEHHLRRLINSDLELRSFSHFLNRLRIRQACEWLASHEHASTPVMNIALDLGYGSIGPFNRAFKSATGLTPTQYRADFQNRL